MTDQEMMAYLTRLGKTGSVLGLASIQNLLDALGNPQDRIRTVHVAGTNGKGSVISYLKYILMAAGYRVGTYTSPAVMTYWEKIQLNGENILPQDAAEMASQVKAAADRLAAEGKPEPTIFEAETAMAFLYFTQKKADIAIIETGMGGTLDATNVIRHPDCEIITSVSMDHVGILGNTLSEIARTKAGIIMPHTKVVLYKQSTEVESVVRTRCAEQEAELIVTDDDALTVGDGNLLEQHFSYRTLKELCIHLPGEHQMHNAAAAIEAAWVLGEAGLEIPEKAICEGLTATRWPGRFEVIARDPLFIIDGAHNLDAAEKLREAILRYFPERPRIFLMGIFADKDYRGIIQLTNDLASEIITINSDNARSIPSAELEKIISEQCAGRQIPICSSETPAMGVRKAVAAAAKYKDAVIIAFGSLSHLGEISACVKNGMK